MTRVTVLHIYLTYVVDHIKQKTLHTLIGFITQNFYYLKTQNKLLEMVIPSDSSINLTSSKTSESNDEHHEHHEHHHTKETSGENDQTQNDGRSKDTTNLGSEPNLNQEPGQGPGQEPGQEHASKVEPNTEDNEGPSKINPLGENSAESNGDMAQNQEKKIKTEIAGIGTISQTIN